MSSSACYNISVQQAGQVLILYIMASELVKLSEYPALLKACAGNGSGTYRLESVVRLESIDFLLAFVFLSK